MYLLLKLKIGDRRLQRQATKYPAMERLLKALPASTSQPLPASRHQSSARVAATAAPLQAAPRVLSDRVVIRITAELGGSFLDRMIALVEGAKRQKTPNEIALTILLSGLTIIFLLGVVSLRPFATYAEAESGLHIRRPPYRYLSPYWSA